MRWAIASAGHLLMTAGAPLSAFSGFRFPPEVITVAVPGDRWFVDETYVKVSGRWTYLYRAVDQHGQVIDIYLSKRRDLLAARAFFTCVSERSFGAQSASLLVLQCR